MWHVNTLLLVILTLVLTACTANDSKPSSQKSMMSNPEEVYRASQCGGLNFSYDFSETLSEFRQKHPNVPLAEDRKGGLLFISVGQQPHPGYQAHWEAIDSAINVSILPPQPGGFYPQVITKPCLVLAIPANWPKPLQVLKKS